MAAATDEYVRSLLAIATDRIAKDDRACCICFVDFGKRKLDGEIEYAAALPKGTCRHIFGHLCLTKWLERDNRCPLCRFVLFRKGKSEVDDNVSASVDFAEPPGSRVVLRGGGSFEDAFPDHATDEEEFETPAEINETLREGATPVIDVARPPATLEEVDEAGATQSSLCGTSPIRGFGPPISFIWEQTSSFLFQHNSH
ncbi:hypothetical protein N7G274_010537 [Stereocaulon virgatum]|uniref:RING-type domain-containing protein n=1 Tax=Stereocaulon virgatum TaxID=373712 RepID=A0ABR3ZTD6_9LECA